MRAATLFIGVAGFIQIGYLPIMDADEQEGVRFEMRTVIVIGEAHLLLSDDDLDDLCIFIRFQSHLNPEPGAEEPLNFKLQAGREFQLLQFTKNDELQQISLNAASMSELLRLLPLVLNYSWERYSFREQFLGEITTALVEAADECRNDGSYINYMARHTHDPFIIELSCNFGSFFVQYCAYRRALYGPTE